MKCIRGAILSGGQSTRMGSDKGLLTQNNLTWSQITASKLALLHIPVIVSVNEEQSKTYSKIFSADHLITDDKSISVKGPLLGLLSVHQQFPNDDLFILACDMIDMNLLPLQNLLDCYQLNSHEAFVYTTNEKPQPLCAIYTSGGLDKLSELNGMGQLKNFSMMHVLECINTKYVLVPEEQSQCFNNYNSSFDLRKKYF
jgi:molybdopterin-guanine dinucleotide biosynthesis protein A